MSQPLRRALGACLYTLSGRGSRGPHGLPILAYHSVADVSGSDVETVSPAAFEEHMGWLRRHGIAGVTVSELVRSLGDRSARERAVAISFDDGYLDNYEVAHPLLRKFDMRATVYVTAHYVGERSTWNRPDYIGHRAMLGWPEIRDLAASGVEIGSHGMHHVDLTALSPESLRLELTRSRTMLEEHSGVRVVGFSAPFGRVDPRVLAAANEAGYSYVVGGGRFVSNFSFSPGSALRRMTITRDDSLGEFAKKVCGAYRWRAQ